MTYKVLFDHCFLAGVLGAVGFLFGYVLRERQLAKRRQKELEETNKILNMYADLGRRAARFCHEISNYIGALTAHLERVSKLVPADPKRRRVIEFVHNISHDLITIARGFRLAVKGHFDESRKWFYLQDLVEPLLFAQVHGTFRKLRINATCQCDVVWYFSRRMSEVFLNLIVNACEAMETVDRRELRITAHEQEGKLVVRVSDTGLGMSDEVRERIFEYGFTTKQGGTGQGMAIVKEIVEKEHGVIEVNSAQGQGTTFTRTFSPIKAEKPRILLVSDAVGDLVDLFPWRGEVRLEACSWDSWEDHQKEKFDLTIVHIAKGIDVAKGERLIEALQPPILVLAEEEDVASVLKVPRKKCRAISQPFEKRVLREIVFDML